MSITEAAICACQATPRADDIVWCCKACYRYWKGPHRLTSVSKVIHTLLPTDYSAINPVVLEGARLRGVFVDTYFCEWLTDPLDVIPLRDVGSFIAPQFPVDGEKYAGDTMHRIEMLLEWWQKSGIKCLSAQKIIHSDDDGIAGTMDLSTDRGIYDLKCVSRLQPAYGLQLGAFASYDDSAGQGLGIIHCTKDRVRLVPYDAAKCKRQWRSCVSWFNTAKELQ
jgi:hypothetical protein